jgi:hypothetical protein
MRRAQLSNITICIALLTLALLTQHAQAVVDWNEGTNGDLSDNGNAPTNLGTWGPGTHSIIASSDGLDGSADIDDFRFSIPAGSTLLSLTNSAYTGTDQTAFVGIAAGTTINHATAPTGLLGYTHFGPGQGNTGMDLFPLMSPPVSPQGPGNYSVWWQQAGLPATVQLDFVVTPEPASAMTLVLLAAAFTTTRKRRARP